LANVFGSLALPASTTLCMLPGAAEANTSALSPSLMLVASAELAANWKTTLVPGWSFSNCLPRSVNTSVSEAAAKTWMVSMSFSFDEVHAASVALSSSTATTAAIVRTRVKPTPQPRHWWL
jgi:hypothetical protein